MEDLLKLTKNYYQKTEQEKLEVRKLIYADLLQIVEEEDMGYLDFCRITDHYVELMVNREDYEIADVINILSRELIKNYYGIK